MTREFRPELGAVFDLSSRVKLRVTGVDRVRYLNGQITNDVRKATASQAIHACLLNAKGKINADIFVVVQAESFLVDSEPEMREQLPARLERYVIADDVQVEDVTDEFALLHVIGGEASLWPAEGTVVQAERFGCAGTDVWLGRSEHEAALAGIGGAAPGL